MAWTNDPPSGLASMNISIGAPAGRPWRQGPYLVSPKANYDDAVR